MYCTLYAVLVALTISVDVRSAVANIDGLYTFSFVAVLNLAPQNVAQLIIANINLFFIRSQEARIS